MGTSVLFVRIALLGNAISSFARPHAEEQDARGDAGLSARLVLHASSVKTAMSWAAHRLARRPGPAATSTLRASHDEFRRIAEEQGALRHLATLVARNVPPAEVFNAVAREMGQILGAEHTVINRYEPGGTAVTTVGSWNYEGIVPPGSRWEFEPGSVSDLVYRAKAPGRVHTYEGTDELATRLRERGVVSSVGCPIVVGRHLWGVAIASSTTARPLPPGTEAQMLDFVELAAAAIANAQSHSDLIKSRARLVAATDEIRRRIERDLHDGTQQHLVSVLLNIRTMEKDVPPDLQPLRSNLSQTAEVLEDVLAELQEIARGLHPSILARGGLKQALTTLARRSPIPVNTRVSIERVLPQAVEVTVYYIVAEALTNAAKYANATAVEIDLAMSDGFIRLSVRDDGVGGADPARGTGLAGLTDRVVALGGTLEITSKAGAGTTLTAEIPSRPGPGG
jgi:signal transduction histidine kinase